MNIEINLTKSENSKLYLVRLGEEEKSVYDENGEYFLNGGILSNLENSITDEIHKYLNEKLNNIEKSTLTLPTILKMFNTKNVGRMGETAFKLEDFQIPIIGNYKIMKNEKAISYKINKECLFQKPSVYAKGTLNRKLVFSSESISLK